MNTVLVVEDDPAIADLMRGILEDEGYCVLAASDGRAALETLGRHACDMIFVDLMMPVMDGRTLRRALAAAPAHQHIPVVLMTAASHITDGDRGQFAAVLRKPFDLDDVLALTSRLLPGRPSGE
jgi:two-component system, OmpR family, alkaline phosphatase synthesis response regulator PhoP